MPSRWQLRQLSLVVASLWASSLTGCFSMMMDAQVGYTGSMNNSERRGVAAQAGRGLSIGDKTAENLGLGMSVRSKIAKDLLQLDLSPHMYVLAGSGTTPYGRAGVNMLQLEKVEGDLAFGMGSPYGELGMFFTPFVVSAFAEYDLRFFHQPNEGFFGVMVGLGGALSSSAF